MGLTARKEPDAGQMHRHNYVESNDNFIQINEVLVDYRSHQISIL